MVLKEGEKVHVVVRRLFEGDVRRHLVGEVVAASESTARLRGYTFLFNPSRNEWVRRPESRQSVISLVDGGVFVTVLPADVDVERLSYQTTAAKRLVLTDGSFAMDVNEFGLNR